MPILTIAVVESTECAAPLQDYVKFGTDSSTVNCDDRSQLRWDRIVIVRYAIILPFLAVFLVVSYTRYFMHNFWFGQFWCVCQPLGGYRVADTPLLHPSTH